MDYEKKYSEALERARQFSEHPLQEDSSNIVEYIFPELQESKDERIRKEIIEKFKILGDGKIPVDINYADIFTWLEKQGEKKPFDYENANIQQKDFAPKIEPKFKIGDWVIDKQGIVHQIANVIEIVTCHTYGYDIVGGGYFNDNTEGVRLWSIKDSKDGDVLAEDTCTFIIKKLNHDLTAEIYCCLYDDGDFEFNSNLGFDDTCTYPATKEQRDLLFQKMKEEGYKWDAEKKELKKISQRMISAEAKEAMYDKPTDNDMVEALRTEYEKGKADVIAEMQKHNDAIKPKFNVGDYIVSKSGLKYYITGIFKGYYMTESGCIITLDAQDNYKVYNNFWSKEEEELLNNICNLLQNPDSIKANQHVIGNIVDWLKSLKDRVQPKQEWSEDDEKRLQSCINILKAKSLMGKVDTANTMWLKSLKQRIGG